MLQNQLAKISVNGDIDGQSVLNEFWYFPLAASGMALTSVMACVGWTWVNKVMPLLSGAYNLHFLYGLALGGFRITTRGTIAAPEFRSVRKLWVERQKQEANFAGITGGLDAEHPMPSYVAYGCDKLLGTAFRINPANGVIDFGQQEPRFGDSNFRIAGMTEESTINTEANLLYAARRTSMQAAAGSLKQITLTAAMGGEAADVGKVVNMAVLSENIDGQPRLDKSAGSNPNDWIVNYVVSGVSGIIVNQEVTSQVSRKRKPKKYA